MSAITWAVLVLALLGIQAPCHAYEDVHKSEVFNPKTEPPRAKSEAEQNIESRAIARQTNHPLYKVYLNQSVEEVRAQHSALRPGAEYLGCYLISKQEFAADSGDYQTRYSSHTPSGLAIVKQFVPKLPPKGSTTVRVPREHIFRSEDDLRLKGNAIELVDKLDLNIGGKSDGKKSPTPPAPSSKNPAQKPSSKKPINISSSSIKPQIKSSTTFKQQVNSSEHPKPSNAPKPSTKHPSGGEQSKQSTKHNNNGGEQANNKKSTPAHPSK